MGPHVNLICSGKRTPPLDRIPAWADALGLSGDARDEFIRLGHLAHAPEQVRQEVERMRSELAAARQDVGDLRLQVADLIAENARLAAKLTKIRHD